MNDQLPPPGWFLRPDTWPYWMPNTVLGTPTLRRCKPDLGKEPIALLTTRRRPPAQAAEFSRRFRMCAFNPRRIHGHPCRACRHCCARRSSLSRHRQIAAGPKALRLGCRLPRRFDQKPAEATSTPTPLQTIIGNPGCDLLGMSSLGIFDLGKAAKLELDLVVAASVQHVGQLRIRRTYGVLEELLPVRRSPNQERWAALQSHFRLNSSQEHRNGGTTRSEVIKGFGTSLCTCAAALVPDWGVVKTRSVERNGTRREGIVPRPMPTVGAATMELNRIGSAAEVLGAFAIACAAG
jgi:hypothetical protein